MPRDDEPLSRIELLQGTLDLIILQTLRWGPATVWSGAEIRAGSRDSSRWTRLSPRRCIASSATSGSRPNGCCRNRQRGARVPSDGRGTTTARRIAPVGQLSQAIVPPRAPLESADMNASETRPRVGARRGIAAHPDGVRRPVGPGRGARRGDLAARRSRQRRSRQEVTACVGPALAQHLAEPASLALAPPPPGFAAMR